MQFVKVNWVNFQEEKIPKLGEGRAELFQAGLKRGRGGARLVSQLQDMDFAMTRRKKVRYTEVEKRRDKEDVKYNKE